MWGKESWCHNFETISAGSRQSFMAVTDLDFYTDQWRGGNRVTHFMEFLKSECHGFRTISADFMGGKSMFPRRFLCSPDFEEECGGRASTYNGIKYDEVVDSRTGFDRRRIIIVDVIPFGDGNI